MTGIRQVVRSRAFLVLVMVPAVAGCWEFVQSLAERDGSYLITGGRWLDVQTGTLVENDGIGIRDGRIVSIGVPPDTAEFLTEFTLQDDMTILPGLIDLHAHYAVDLFGEGRVDETAAYPELFLANGVTTTFPAGEMDPVRMRELRLAIERGERDGPRILNSGPYYGSWRRGWDDEAMTADSLRREVDHWAAQGAAGFKAKGIRPEHLSVLIDQAHEHGLTVTAHLDSGFGDSVNPRDAIHMGIDRVEHFLGGDMMPADRTAYASLEAFDDFEGDALRDIIDLYVSRGVNFDATLSIYGYWGPHDPEMTEYWTDELRFLTPYMREVVEGRPQRPVNESFAKMSPIKRRTLKAFYDGGGRDLITLGTDHPSWGRYWSPFAVHRELLALARAGVPPADVFRIATLNSARAMGLEAELGSIEEGKSADLVILRGNPLEDVRAARDVRFVFAQGRLHSPDELLARAEGSIGPANASEESAWRPGGRR
ncbi:amidohydrolase family protein [Candidatus Palauibacter sp.]|uniref:amidohydrolase family protein n=1 Tax=Candidatus Palauibacter sp. TaxID=3101350 RepID=UPI003CC56DA8